MSEQHKRDEAAPTGIAHMQLPERELDGVAWDAVTATTLVDRAARRWGDRPFLRTPDSMVTFAEARERSQRMAAGLRKLGVGHGDRVATLLGNTEEFVTTYLATLRLGASLVPLHTRYVRDEIEAVLRSSQASVLVTACRFYRQDFGATIASICPDFLAGEVGEQRSRALPDLRSIISVGGTFDGAKQYSAVAEDDDVIEEDQAKPTDLLQIKYTSGSTAAPKGVMLTHANTIRNAYNMGARIGLDESDLLFSGMPFYHAGGSILTLLTCLSLGSCAVFLPRYDAGEALDLIERERCTAHIGMEVMFLREIGHPDFRWERVSTLRKGWIAGGTEAVTRVHEAMPFPFVNIYGLTEMSGNVCMTRSSDPDEIRLGWAGEAQPGLDVAIFDSDSGLKLPAGEVGEIGVRGWAVMEGYLGDDSATQAVLSPDGWLRPGDLGLIDERGYLKFLGRSRESLKVGGENVSVLELEEALAGHKAVRVAVVVAAAHDGMGEVPVAFVELKADREVSAGELLDFCRERLAPFKVPAEVHLVAADDWPLTGPEKISRAILRKRAMAGQQPAARAT